METVNLIFENLGIDRLGRVLKNYCILIFLLKETVLSFFMVNTPVEDLPCSMAEIYREILSGPRDETLTNTDFLRLMYTLTHFNTDVEIEEPIAN